MDTKDDKKPVSKDKEENKPSLTLNGVNANMADEDDVLLSLQSVELFSLLSADAQSGKKSVFERRCQDIAKLAKVLHENRVDGTALLGLTHEKFYAAKKEKGYGAPEDFPQKLLDRLFAILHPLPQQDTGEKSGSKRKAPDSGSSSSRKKRKHEHKTPHKSSPEEPAPKHSPPRNQAGKIPDEIKDNPHDFVRLYAVKYSGLEFRGDFAFRRNKAETLGETLQKLRAGETGSTLVVEGPPGTGKSTTVWCHVVQSARKETVVWLHFGAGTVSSTLTVLSPAGIEHSKRNSADLLRQLKKEDDPLLNDATLLVVDGVTREHKTAGVLEDVDAWKQDRIDTRRVVIVTSQGLSLSDQETHRAKFLFFQMPGWQLQEYHKACENDHFLKSVETALDAHDPKDLTRGELKDDAKKQLQHKLQAKFELAGHSARWMFGFRTEEVQKAIDGAIGRSRNLATKWQAISHC